MANGAKGTKAELRFYTEYVKGVGYTAKCVTDDGREVRASRKYVSAFQASEDCFRQILGRGPKPREMFRYGKGTRVFTASVVLPGL